MRKLLLLLLIFVPFIVNAQNIGIRNNLGPLETEYYRTMSPGNTSLNSILVWTFPDSTRKWHIYQRQIFFDSLTYATNGPITGNVLWIRPSDGMIQNSPANLLFPDSAIYSTRTWVNTQGFLKTFTESDPLSLHLSDTSTALNHYLRSIDTTSKWAPKLPYLLSYIETDPIYTVGILNYFNKTQSDGRYLQSFTEVDPLSVHVTDSASMLSKYLRKTDASALYQAKGTYLTSESDPLSIHIVDSANMLSPYIRSNVANATFQVKGSYLTTEVDPVYTAGITNYYNKSQSDARYLQSFTETDPLSVHISDSSSMLSKYLRKTDTATLSNRINLKVNISDTAIMLSPYVRTNVAAATYQPIGAYLTSITSSQVTTALGYTPYNGATNPNNYLSSITSGNITSALGYTPVTNGRTLTINGTTQDLTANRTWSVGDVLTTSSYSNPSWITSLTWSKITGSPTTLSGYGITDGITSSSLTSTLASYVTSSSLTSTLGSYATTSALTTGLAGKQNTVSLTTTGTSGAATFNSSTGALNIPQYTAGPTYTQGTGISIVSNVITNTAPAVTPTINSVVTGRSIVTTAAAANGWQISSTRTSTVSYSVTINTSVSLSGNATGYVVAEIASTNSVTASDWVEVSRVPSGQSGTLVIGLVLNQIGGGNITATVPVGYYCRLRSVNTAGTPTYALNSGQEVVL